MRENGSGWWKTVDIQRVTRVTGIRWRGFTGLRRTPSADPLTRPPHLSPLRWYPLHDGPFGIRPVALTMVARPLINFPGSIASGLGIDRMWARIRSICYATPSGTTQLMEQAPMPLLYIVAIWRCPVFADRRLNVSTCAKWIYASMTSRGVAISTCMRELRVVWRSFRSFPVAT